MSSLVAMIVLAYLLVIASCVAIWAAVSLRRAARTEAALEPRSEHGRAELDSPSDDMGPSASGRPHSHDAYRGARAKARPMPVPDAERPATAVPLFPIDREPLPAAPLRAPIPIDAGTTEPRPGGVRVTESKRSRERSARRRAEEEATDDRAAPEDAFERFLRASKDFER